MIEKSKEKKQADIRQASSLFGYNCRDEATRTPDPYVPNVVRYQLRYIPISVCGCKVTLFFVIRATFCENFHKIL